MARFYLISFDPAITDADALHEVIKSCGFASWWHYLGSAYIIKTTSKNLADIHEILLKKWPQNRFLIIKIDPSYRNGWLPPDAWKWFRRNVDRA